MRVTHVLKSTRKVLQEQGARSLVRLSKGRVLELAQASLVLRSDVDRRRVYLQRLINKRLEFDEVQLTNGEVLRCEPTVLTLFLYRSFPEIQRRFLAESDRLDPLALLLLCDALYRTWRYKELALLAPAVRAMRAESSLTRRADNLVRRGAMNCGMLSEAERGLATTRSRSLSDWLLKGDVWNAAGRMDLASDAYEHAIGLQSDNPMARLHYGFHLLKKGKVRDGLICWGTAERMFGYYPLKRAEPLWRGESLDGRKLLIVFEHGFGDMIQFARYIVPLAERYPAAEIVGLVPAPIVGLLSDCLPQATFLCADPMDCDFHVPATQLPNVLDAGIYVPQVYMRRDRGRVSRGDAEPLRVGVCWRGHPRQYEQSRSVQIEQFATLFDIPDVTFEVLLNTVTEAERAALVPFDNVLMPPIRDFSDLLDRIEECDLVVSVDTSIVHLAGAAGKRVLLLCRPDACWRWGASGSTSPWYPEVEVLRHPFDLDWTDVLGQARGLLLEAASKTSVAQRAEPAPA